MSSLLQGGIDCDRPCIEQDEFFALDVIGPDALRLTPVDGEGVWTGPYLQSFAYTIGGGTTDIQRNIVGERMLGLPRVR